MKRCRCIDEFLVDKHREPSTLEKMLEGMATVEVKGRGIDVVTLIYTFKCVDCGKIRQEKYTIG